MNRIRIQRFVPYQRANAPSQNVPYRNLKLQDVFDGGKTEMDMYVRQLMDTARSKTTHPITEPIRPLKVVLQNHKDDGEVVFLCEKKKPSERDQIIRLTAALKKEKQMREDSEKKHRQDMEDATRKQNITGEMLKQTGEKFVECRAMWKANRELQNKRIARYQEKETEHIEKISDLESQLLLAKLEKRATNAQLGESQRALTEIHTCGICVREYKDEAGRIPRVLFCGHTLCEFCVKNIARAFTFTCPYCRQVTKVQRKLNSPEAEKNLPKNFALIE